MSISKILIRRGTNQERLSAQDVGVVLSMGEPGFTVDTKRLYVGDGSTIGGIPIGVKNLGAVNQLFGTFGGTGYSEAAYYILTLSGVEAGDFIYDRETRILYSLTGQNTFPPPTGSFVKYDFTVQINPNQLEFNPFGQIQIRQEGITPNLISSAIAGGSLSKPTVNGPIVIRDKGVENRHLEDMPAFTVKINNKLIAAEPVDLVIGPKQFLGRTPTSALTALNFESILAESNIQTANGVAVQKPSPSTSIFSLCSNVFQVSPTKANIIPPTTLNSTLSVQAQVIFNNYLGVSGIGNFDNRVFAGQLHTRNGIINAGTGILSGGDLYCREIFLLGTGNINTNGGGINTGGGTINSGGGTITTSNGNINTGTGDVFCRRVFASDDVTAFFTPSDLRLKQNLAILENNLTALDNLNAYTFTWISSAQNDTVMRSGEDVGLVAQEVKEVLPWAVAQRESGYYSVDYTRVVPYLLGCIKDLKKEIDQLKNEVRSLNI